MPKLNLNLPSFSLKKILLLGLIFVMLIGIPISVYLVKQQQDQRTQAVANTTLSFSPADQSAGVGDVVTFDVFVSPGNNQVSFIKLVIKFDPTLISTTADDFVVDPLSNLAILQGPVVGEDNLSVVLSVQADPTKVIQTNTQIGKITFSVDNPSDIPTEITIDPTQTQISSIAAPDSFTENVFLSATPGTITILSEGTLTPTPTATPSGTLTPTPTTNPNATATPTDTPTTPVVNEAPVCTELLTDRGTTGVAPYSITFIANGSDSDGTIKKVSFNFGDSILEDVTVGGGIGTNSVSIQRTHTYNNVGTYTATATMTDNSDAISTTVSCSVDITVTAGDGSVISGTTSTPTPTIAAPGPQEAIVGVGIAGALLFVIGALLFLAL